MARIGVLALQGAFREHAAALRRLGADVCEVRQLKDMEGLEGMVIPGGESTTIGKLLVEWDMLEPLRRRILDGMPVYGSCAGLILLCKEIEGSDQPRLGVLDATVRRNAFGRQVDSFETDLHIDGLAGEPLRAVFIRAPLISRVGEGVRVLARLDADRGERIVAVPWMSNWQYANITPIRQYRGANALPRELKLFSNNGETYLSANVVDEARALRKETKELGNIEVTNANPYIVRNLFNGNNGAFEIEADITPGNSDLVGLSLFNDKEERTLVYLDLKNKRLVMDRTESGLTDFGKEAERHNIEKAAEAAGLMKGKLSQDIALNFKNDFALATWAPLSLCGTAQDLNRWKEDGQITGKEKTYHLDIFVDKCSVEVFVNGGRIAMTNLVFPTAPYNNIKVWAEGGKAEVSKAKVYSLGL